MKQISNNPYDDFKYGSVLLYAYIFLSALSVIFDRWYGFVSGDIRNLNIDSGYAYLHVSIISVAITILLCALFCYFFRITPGAKFNYTNLSVSFKYVIASISVLYFITNASLLYIVDSTNQALRGLVVSSALIQPGILLLIYLYKEFEKESKNWFYRCIATIYLITSFLTGFMWTYIPLLILFATKIRNKIEGSLLLLAAIIFLPLARILKFFLYSGYGFFDTLKIVINDFSAFFIQSYQTVLSHFNLAQNVYFAKMHLAEISSLAMQNKYLPWFQGYFGSLLYKLIYDFDGPRALNNEIAALINGKSTWSAALPIHFFVSNLDEISLLFLSYTIIEIFVVAYLSKILIGGRYGFLFASIMFCELILPGWHWPVSNLLQGLIIYLIINKIGAKAIDFKN